MRARVLVAMLLVAACRRTPEVPPETRMEQALHSLRTAVARFQADQGHAPHALEELVPRYLPTLPVDPVTGSRTSWRVTTEESVQPSADFSAAATAPAKPVIVAVSSGAPGEDRNGRRWADY